MLGSVLTTQYLMHRGFNCRISTAVNVSETVFDYDLHVSEGGRVQVFWANQDSGRQHRTAIIRNQNVMGKKVRVKNIRKHIKQGWD